MSATGRGGERHPSDFYSTPSWCVRRLLEAWKPQGMEWLEPGAGNGAIIRAVNGYALATPHWTSVELREEERLGLQNYGEVVIAPFLGSPDPLGVRQFDVALGNPPYSQAMEFILQALKHAREVAFLLRLPFAASKKRAGFMRTYPPDVYVLPDRPSFTGQGTDATDYAWMVWNRDRPPQGSGKFCVLATTPTEEKREG